MVSKLLLAAASLAFAAGAPTLAHACSRRQATDKGGKLSQLLRARMAQSPSDGQASMMKLMPTMQANQARMTSGGAIDWDGVRTQ